MIRMFVRHSVQDYPTWKQAYDAFDAERSQMGVVGQAVFQAADDSNDVTIWHDFESIEAARSFAGSDQLAEAMRGAGVVGSLSIWFTSPG